MNLAITLSKQTKWLLLYIPLGMVIADELLQGQHISESLGPGTALGLFFWGIHSIYSFHINKGKKDGKKNK